MARSIARAEEFSARLGSSRLGSRPFFLQLENFISARKLKIGIFCHSALIFISQVSKSKAKKNWLKKAMHKKPARFQLENWDAPAWLGSAWNIYSSTWLSSENSSSNSSLPDHTIGPNPLKNRISRYNAVWHHCLNSCNLQKYFQNHKVNQNEKKENNC